MASYYYLIASLPMLRADAPPPLSYGDFLELCRTQVSAATFRLLEDLSVRSDKGPLLKDWAAFYRVLDGELCYQRSQRLGQTCPAPEDRSAADAVRRVLAAEHPLAAEQLLLEMEFRQLDALTGLHSFDDTFLFGYALKLKLLERLHGFRYAEGRDAFVSLLRGIRQQIYSLGTGD